MPSNRGDIMLMITASTPQPWPTGCGICGWGTYENLKTSFSNKRAQYINPPMWMRTPIHSQKNVNNKTHTKFLTSPLIQKNTKFPQCTHIINHVIQWCRSILIMMPHNPDLPKLKQKFRPQTRSYPNERLLFLTVLIDDVNKGVGSPRLEWIIPS